MLNSPYSHSPYLVHQPNIPSWAYYFQCTPYNDWLQQTPWATWTQTLCKKTSIHRWPLRTRREGEMTGTVCSGWPGSEDWWLRGWLGLGWLRDGSKKRSRTSRRSRWLGRKCGKGGSRDVFLGWRLRQGRWSSLKEELLLVEKSCH